MKSFFSRLQTGAENKKPAVIDEELQIYLKEVQASLQKMRKASAENFPLLNESTRLGRCLVACLLRSFPWVYAKQMLPIKYPLSKNKKKGKDLLR